MRFLAAELERSNGRMPNLWSLVKPPEDFWGDLATHGRGLLKELLEGAMESWRDEWVKVEWHKPLARPADSSESASGTSERPDAPPDPHARRYRNGYYRRKRWPTALGMLSDVRVPRCREPGLTRRMFARLDDHRDGLADSVIDMLLSGVSTRRVGELLERILDLPVSPGQVSRLAKRLDVEVRAFHTRPLKDEYAYLLLDAVYLKARSTPRLVSTGLRRTRKRVLLVAYGVTAAGIRQVIGFRVANGETQSAWSGFLNDLRRRGLEGQSLRLITSDGAGGLVAAVDEVYPFLPRQRCWFHKMQNVAGKVKRRDQQPVLKGLRGVYAAPNRRSAEPRFHTQAITHRN